MKASAPVKFHIFIGIVAVNLLLAVLAYLVVLPAIVPQALDPAAESLGWRLALLVFIVSGVVSTGVAMLMFSLFASEKTLQDIADALRQPTLFIDQHGRYAVVNREAEKALGISRDRDIGKVLDQRISQAIANAGDTTSDLNLKAVVVLKDNVHYQVIENPLNTAEEGGGRQRLIILREVDSLVRLRDAIREINGTMAILNANTQKISSSAVSLSQGATEQASSLSAITSSMDEFSKKIQGNSESAAKSSQLAAQAREAAERSGGEIAHALTAMTDVQDAGIRIARIVKLIDDIAFQTNLLALNAAVEAARAGRQGKGFAVVADEVRNLAGRSAKAAKDTASMVEDVTERIGNASNYISKLEEMLRNIVQDAIRMADSSASAGATSAEQAAGILQVNHELGQMNSVTHNTMSAAEQTATAVEVLARQVNMLKAKLDELSIDFSLDSDTPAPAAPALSINLHDDPGPLGSPARTHSYLTDTYAGFSDGAGAEDAQRPEWKLHDYENNPLSSLLSSHGNGKGYTDYLESSTKSLEDLGAALYQKPGQAPEQETPEGDKVVKPTQNIHLDDSEFGRY